MLIETDVLIAALDADDPHNAEARKIITELKVALSPYTLIELDLLIRSGKVAVANYRMFWEKMGETLNLYRIKVLPPRPKYHSKAEELRRQYGLTYFDSLHAAVAITSNMQLVSYDHKAYSKIKGLRYLHPSNV